MSDEDATTSLTTAPEPAAPAPAVARKSRSLSATRRPRRRCSRPIVSGRLPHAWLITGPRGIGKATLAFRFARFLFARRRRGAGFSPQRRRASRHRPGHPVSAASPRGGHPDLLVVERSYDPQAASGCAPRSSSTTRATIARFLRLTPAEGGWRVVIVDGADAMNRNAANALLKILEEPPQRAVLLLVSDNPGRLLPTIRSRCRRLALQPLPQAQVDGGAARATARPRRRRRRGAGAARARAASAGRWRWPRRAASSSIASSSACWSACPSSMARR